jgi:aspartyl aminopeptidase
VATATSKHPRPKTDSKKALEAKLLFSKVSGWEKMTRQQQKTVDVLADDYKAFLDESKTERETLSTIAQLVEAAGYVDIQQAEPGDRKLVLKYNEVAGALVDIRDIESFEQGFLMIGAHIDAPRLDLKPFPLFEAEDMAYMKTHYYGGIKKYQWVTRPLALHGVVVLDSGKTVPVRIGEKADDPVFTINDILPHLAQGQNKKTATSAIEGEQLNILVGSIPLKFKTEKNAIKLNILQMLNRQYGLVEQDFISAELQLVPAGNARDVGFDRSFVGAYGQDDRICAYLGMRALLDVGKANPKRNRMMVFFDKEEIGSMGNSGAHSNLIERIVNDILQHCQRGDYHRLIRALEKSWFLSADVNAGIDPEWKDVSEPLNAAKIGYGVCLTKYTGTRGKFGSSEAHAEFVAAVRNAFNRDNVRWQSAELGKVDQGGGGTVALHLARYGMEVVDCGTALLSMHSPFEIASKIDIYHTYKAYKAFYRYL